jgi:membrane protease YdiL (CAAX protease family)
MTSLRHPERAGSPVAQRARRVTPWAFPVLYLGWAYLWWTPVVRSGTSVWSGANLVLFLVGGAGPLLAGVTLAWLTGGTDRVRDLGRRLVDVRRITALWWLIILAFWPVFMLVMAGAAIVVGVSPRPVDVTWDVLTDPPTLAFQLVLALVFPAVEEIGLRGYWFDRLRARFSMSAAALINGATWAVWHAPFVLLPGYYANTSFDPELWWWMPKIVCDTLLIVWVYTSTRRSILAALIFHGMMNLTGELLGLAPEMQPFMLVGYGLAAAALITTWRRTASGHGRATVDHGG